VASRRSKLHAPASKRFTPAAGLGAPPCLEACFWSLRILRLVASNNSSRRPGVVLAEAFRATLAAVLATGLATAVTLPELAGAAATGGIRSDAMRRAVLVTWRIRFRVGPHGQRHS